MESKPDLRGIYRKECHVVTKTPLDMLSIDLIGRLPRSQGYFYILSIVDLATKFIMLYALRNSVTSEIVSRLEDYFKHYGTPQRILSDNGPQFTSTLWMDFIAHRNIVHVMTTIYQPEGHHVGRYSREVGRILRTYCNKENRLWSQYLHESVYFMNNTVSECHQEDPQQVVLNLPCNDFVSRVLKNFNNAYIGSQEIRKAALESQYKYRAKGLNRLDIKNLVYRRIHTLNSALDYTIAKLFNLYEGPYVVININRNVATIQ